MAKPKQGMIAILAEVWRGMMLGGFNGPEVLLIGQAYEAGGPFRLNLSELARISGYCRETLRKAHRRLEGCNVLLDRGDGSFRLNVRPEAWTRGPDEGLPRFSADELAWIREGSR